MNSGQTLPALLSHAGWLRRLAVSLVRDPDAAEDVVQGTLIAAWNQPPETDRDLRPWLAKVARNEAHDLRRGESRRRARETAAEADALVARAPATPEELIGNIEIHRVVAEVVSALDEPYRSTLIAHHYEGRPLVEIARSAGIPEGTVRWRLKEGLERVRVALDGRYEGDRKRWQRALAPLLPAGGLVPAGGPAKTPSDSVAARDGVRAAGAKPAVRPGAFGLPRWFVPVALGGLVAAIALIVVWVVALGARAPEAPSAGAGAVEGTGVATRAAPVVAKKGFVVPRLATPTAAPEPGTDRALEATLILRQMLAALVDNNYDAFLAYGHDGFKARVLKSNVTEISGRLGPRLRAGFDLHMLGQLKREDHELFLYKLEFRDGSDDALIRFSLEGSQVVGFFEN